MSTLRDKLISATFPSLLHTSDNAEFDSTGVIQMQDGNGNPSSLFLGRHNQGAQITGNFLVTGTTHRVIGATTLVGGFIALSSTANMVLSGNTIRLTCGSPTAGGKNTILGNTDILGTTHNINGSTLITINGTTTTINGTTTNLNGTSTNITGTQLNIRATGSGSDVTISGDTIINNAVANKTSTFTISGGASTFRCASLNVDTNTPTHINSIVTDIGSATDHVGSTTNIRSETIKFTGLSSTGNGKAGRILALLDNDGKAGFVDIDDLKSVGTLSFTKTTYVGHTEGADPVDTFTLTGGTQNNIFTLNLGSGWSDAKGAVLFLRTLSDIDNSFFEFVTSVAGTDPSVFNNKVFNACRMYVAASDDESHRIGVQFMTPVLVNTSTGVGTVYIKNTIVGGFNANDPLVFEVFIIARQY